MPKSERLPASKEAWIANYEVYAGELAVRGISIVDSSGRYPRGREREFVKEIPLLAQGLTAPESADRQNISDEAVNMRRREAIAAFGAKTSTELVAVVIQTGFLEFEPEAEPLKDQLTARQDDVLRLSALGWTGVEIMERLGINRDRLNVIYDCIRLKLKAKNMKHAVLRAFQYGLFEVDEEILDPDELAERNKINVVVEGQTLSTKELGLTDPKELELLKTISILGLSCFFQKDILEAGFDKNAKNPEVRNHNYRRAMGRVRVQLLNTFGMPILERVRVDGNRLYAVKRPLQIGEGNTIEPWTPPPKRASKPKRPRPQVIVDDSPTSPKIKPPKSNEGEEDDNNLPKWWKD